MSGNTVALGGRRWAALMQLGFSAVGEGHWEVVYFLWTGCLCFFLFRLRGLGHSGYWFCFMHSCIYDSYITVYMVCIYYTWFMYNLILRSDIHGRV